MSGTATTKGIGQPVRRKEDARLVVGAGCFSDDVDLPRQTRAFVLRSCHPHARIKGIDTTRAKALKGVLAVLTGADLKADGIKPIPPDASITVPVEAQRKLPDVILVNKNGRISRRRTTSWPSTRSAMSAKAWCWWSPRRSPSPRTPPSWSRSTTSRCRL